ncbi:MAG: adenylate/guanylate cyclase domain-containing protein [Candidatus Cybelea sp.]
MARRIATQTGSGPPAWARPTGTVTFAFTDIEGSTVRWERDREAMKDAVRRHDALMRTAIARHAGYVFKTMGDAFCAAFAHPEDAVVAILGAQRAIAAEDFSAIDGLRVRAALHVGTADERDGDYFGPAVNRVARLLTTGYGGQVLLSGPCADAVRTKLPSRCSLRDLGAHRLKDLAQPERVYQLITPDLAQAFPALRSLDHLSNNLPAQLTSFVGREKDIVEIATLVHEHRLVTLSGAGGVGKTRASLQIAANLIEGFSDGVWLIELAPLASGDYIPSAVAQALELTLATEDDSVESLVRALKGKQTLLVFDNCEHLVEPVGRVIAAILRGCSRVKVLASSRQVLGIDGEATYRMPSLAVPAATSLFAERARAVDNRFALTDANVTVVSEICRRLDGIPLAIELAAARVKVLSPKQLRDHLDKRFQVLTGGDRSALPRHQTMRALIDWSYDLLEERERVLFRRLGIFINGFTLEGAVAVGSGGDLDELDLFDILASLVDKSLVLAEPQGDAVRYRLLESTRAYALEKLGVGGERNLIAGRHLRYLRDRFAELWERYEQTAQGADFESALQTELEDVRAALDGALARSEVIDGAELLANQSGNWLAFGLEAEGTSRCETYLAALPSDELRLRARLSRMLSSLLRETGHKVRAFELATQAVEQARASNDAASLAWTLGAYVLSAMSLHRLDDAERALTEAEVIPWTSTNFRVASLLQRAYVSGLRGDLETAAHTFEQVRKEYRALGNTRGEQSATQNLAEVEHARGHTHRAIALVREMLPAMRSGTDTTSLASQLGNLAGYFVAVDDLSGAFAAARESIRTHSSLPPVITAIAIEHLAFVFALRGDFARAATLEGYAEAAFGRHGYQREFTETTTHDRLTAVLHDRLAPGELARLTAEGAAFASEAAIALALEEP